MKKKRAVFKNKMMSIESKELYEMLKIKHKDIIEEIKQEGCYIWGTGLLGKYAYEECKNCNIHVKGFVDNNSVKWNPQENIYSDDVLKKEDVVILASLYYPDIIHQMEAKGKNKYIFYEELAFVVDEMQTYSPTFKNIFDEMEKNKEAYCEIYDLLSDELSKEIFESLIMFRYTLDVKYNKKAWELSSKEGEQDFDKKIMKQLDENYTFFDVGGYDGASTEAYIKLINPYRKIYFFEPDKLILESVREKFKDEENIVFIQEGVGDKKETLCYNSKENGFGCFEKNGNDLVDMAILDDYIVDHKSYIKMDIEGYELQALKGAEKSIRKYKPLLSVSVYHLPGDIHRLVKLILSWNPDYKLCIRHYTNSYPDTRMYFI